MIVELCDIRLKISDPVGIAVRYIYHHKKRKVVCELYDTRRSLRSDRIVAFVADEALSAAERRSQNHKIDADLEARTILDKAEKAQKKSFFEVRWVKGGLGPKEERGKMKWQQRGPTQKNWKR